MSFWTSNSGAYFPDQNLFTFEQEQYLEGVDNLQIVRGSWRREFLFENSRAYMDLEVGFYTRDEDLSNYFLRVKESYATFHLHNNEDKTLTVGRKKFLWSETDENWGLGIVQPLNNFNPIQSETMGLIGFFYENKILKPVGLRFFMSPVFIPEQGAPFILRNGRFFSYSPWFVEPIESMDLLGTNTNINYEVVEPELEEILVKPAAGISLQLAPDDFPVKLQGSYIYKPQNTLDLPFEASLLIDRVQIEVDPQVRYHSILSADATVVIDSVWSATLSGLADFPERSKYDDNMFYEPMERVVAANSSLTARYLLPFLPILRVSHFQGWEEPSRLRGPLGTLDASLFGGRLPYSKAVKIDLQSRFYPLPRWPMELNMRWVHDYEFQQDLLSTTTQFELVRDLNLFIGADLLRSRSDENKGLIGRFRQNDRIYGGAIYAM